MRYPLSILFALLCSSSLGAEPVEKPAGNTDGRTINQRFGSIDQNLAFDASRAANANGHVFTTRNAQAPTFQYDDRVRVSKFETREATVKGSWLNKLKFWKQSGKRHRESLETS